MSTTHTLVIGAGQAGLAVSHSLTDAAIDHVVLERGRTAERIRDCSITACNFSGSSPRTRKLTLICW